MPGDGAGEPRGAGPPAEDHQQEGRPELHPPPLRLPALVSERGRRTPQGKYSVMGTVLADMSSRTALTRHLGMKTAFLTKNKTANIFGLFLG